MSICKLCIQVTYPFAPGNRTCGSANLRASVILYTTIIDTSVNIIMNNVNNAGPVKKPNLWNNKISNEDVVCNI